jgi:hypothetical protein
MVELRRAHWKTTKHILRYLRGKIEYGLKYGQGYGVKLVDYIDANWAGNAMDMKNTLGCCFSEHGSM